jgi:hypothetical protein
MRGRLVTITAWLVIVACVIIVAARVHSHYRAPVAPAVFTPAPLVPDASATASATAAAPASPTARPKRTVTVTVTETATSPG